MNMEKSKFNQEIGFRIREIREFSNYTRENLAEKANISVQFLADIETGRKSMTVKTLKSLSESLSVSSDYILFGKTTGNSSNPNDSSIYLLLETLSEEQRRDAEEILKIYVRAISRFTATDEQNI